MFKKMINEMRLRKIFKEQMNENRNGFVENGMNENWFFHKMFLTYNEDCFTITDKNYLRKLIEKERKSA